MASRDKTEYIERMSFSQRAEHLLLIISLSLLILSGMALAYHNSSWSHQLVKLMGGPGMRHKIHILSATGLFMLGILHIIFLIFSPHHQKDISKMRFKLSDIRMSFEVLVGWIKNMEFHPRYGYFTPLQKFQYWGILIGCFTMGISGLLLWSPIITLMIFPKSFLDLMIVIHSKEAQIIFILFIIWHLYDVHLAKDYFPMNSVWLTGYMKKCLFRKKHPAAWEEMYE